MDQKQPCHQSGKQIQSGGQENSKAAECMGESSQQNRDAQNWQHRDFVNKQERTQLWINQLQLWVKDHHDVNKRKIRKSTEWRNKKSKIYMNHREYEELYKNHFWFKWTSVKLEDDM